tara:strand:+ start:991 stop:2028 length:1038 start_codon:yes stop_codon:yes gene_type:complete
MIQQQVAGTKVNECRRADASTLACVIPMYNEGGHARDFVSDLHEFVRDYFAEVVILVVDDGSADQTRVEIREAIAEGLPVKFIRLSRNFGKEVALTAGLEALDRFDVSADVVLIMDSDYQHPFATVPEMIRRWEAGIDMVYGVQEKRGNSGALRRALTRRFYSLMSGTNDRVQIPPDAGDFRLIDRSVVVAITQMPERNRYMKGLYAWVGFESEGIPFEADARAAGATSFGFRALFELAVDGLTAFTSWPLRMASIIGAFISFGAFAYGGWIIIERLVIGQPIPGFATLAAAIMFFSGLQLLSIGLLGEYLGRVFTEVKGRPLYIVSEEHGAAPVSEEPVAPSRS